MHFKTTRPIAVIAKFSIRYRRLAYYLWLIVQLFTKRSKKTYRNHFFLSLCICL